VRRQHSPKLDMELVIMDFGDREGQPLINRLGYFHVSVERNRVVIDLSQVTRAQVTEMELVKLFAKSPLVKSVELSMDPEDSGATLVLNTNGATAAEVFQMPSEKKPSRLVVDLKRTKKL